MWRETDLARQKVFALSDQQDGHNMKTISLAEAKAHLSELVARAAEGDPVSITRRGKTVARLIAAGSQRRPIDPSSLRAITDLMPRETEAAGAFVRRMRDDDRY